MPLLGKIVVIKRNGTDGTEFPLTASCLFGRKLDCDIRIQLPQVSKEHCRIEFNENKELILTNLSSVNPTRINGEILQQSERLKHGDLITIIDRSFRFEYPPAPTPKKLPLSTGKGETVKVLQDQQVKSTPGTTDKKKSDNPTDTRLKDGSNLPVCQDQSSGDQQNKAGMDNTMSPFSDLYNMVKRDLVTKPKWKSASLSNTPTSRTLVDKHELGKVSDENVKPLTPKSSQKRRSSTAKPVEGSQSENPSPQVKTDTPAVHREHEGRAESFNTPASQKFTADQVAKQISVKSPSKSPNSRRSSTSQTPEKKILTPQNPAEMAKAEEGEVKPVTRTSPRACVRKHPGVQDGLQEVVATSTSDNTAGNGPPSSKKHKCEDLPLPAPKRKRVSFGGQLSPELFDKRLPPDSPLRRGATPGRRSLGFTHKSNSLLRRASTVGLMRFQLEEEIAANPAKKSSPKKVTAPAKGARTPSPAKGARTPSPAKQSTSKAKTPSPKHSKFLNPSSNQSTPKSSKRLSNASKSPSLTEESLLKTPTRHGRFSVSQISTPSPVPDTEKEPKEDLLHAAEKPQERATPRATRRRSSMKASARKTPKSMLKSVLNVVRSRRSGATHANLKVVSSWADIVRYGQAKPQTECGAKKVTNKRTVVKPTKVTKPKTPARKLKDHTSTGHADSPASIVVGKAFLRSTQLVGAAPKVVCNVALFKKESMKMDEDLSGVSDIFKTPANSRRKSVFKKSDDHPATSHGVGEANEMSVINTPEESGEMMVSPLSFTSTAEPGRYNSEAVTRLLQEDLNGSFIEKLDPSIGLASSELCTVMPTESPTNTILVQTPQQKPAPLECLTGIKRLMKTPKQKYDAIEDLRGALLKTPKEQKLPQEESLEGVEELFTTPNEKRIPSEEELAGLKMLNSPVVCAVSLRRLDQTLNDSSEQQEDQPVENHLVGIQHMMETPKPKKQPVEEDLTGVKQMMKTPKPKKQPVEEDLTGVKQMMKTPKPKKQPVEEDLTGVKQMMETPKPKKQPVEEDLTGVKQMMETPKPKKQPVEEDLTGVKQMMKTPKPKKQPVEEDLTGVKQMMETPKPKKQPVEEDLTGVKQMRKTPKQKNQTVVKKLLQTLSEKGEPVKNDTLKPKGDEELDSLAPGVLPVEDARVESTEKENICPASDAKNDTEEAVGLQIETEEAKTSCQAVEEDTTLSVTEEEQSNRSSPATNTTLSVTEEEQSNRSSPATNTTLSVTEEEQSNRSSPATNTRRGARVRLAQKSQKMYEHHADSESLNPESVPSVRVKRGKSAIEQVTENIVLSPTRFTRGRTPKEPVLTKEPPCASANNENGAIKPGRGRQAKQHVQRDEEAGPITSLKASAEMGVSMKSSSLPRKRKYESVSPPEPEIVLASESAELQLSETEAPVKTNTRARKGRTTKMEQSGGPSDIKSPNAAEEVAKIMAHDKDSHEFIADTKRGKSTKEEMLKSLRAKKSPKPAQIVVEPDDVVESKLPQSSEVQLAVGTKDSTEANLKPRRGRPKKKEIPVTAQVEETSKPSSDSKVVPQGSIEMPLKTRRERRVNPPALKNQGVVEATIETHVESQLKPGTLAVRSSRSARNKRLNPQAEDSANDQSIQTVTTTPAAERVGELSVKKAERSQKVKLLKTLVLNDSQEETQIKPTTDSVTGVVKDEPETWLKRGRRAATIEVPPPVVKSSRGRKVVAKSKPEGEQAEETGTEAKVLRSLTDEAPLCQAESEVLVKRGRGRITKKSKFVAKDTLVSEVMEEAPLNKNDEPAENDPKAGDIKHLGEEPAVEENIQPVRRGRGLKRKKLEAVAEDSIPKRKRGKVTGAETPLPDVAVSGKGQRTATKEPEETAVKEPAPKEDKPVRGRRKATQDVPPPVQDPILEVSVRRGTRGQKKAEADILSAPVRRTRRK